MRELDNRAIEEYGIIEEFLMENAGLAAFYVIHKELVIQNKRFLVFCGIGNNGDLVMSGHPSLWMYMATSYLVWMKLLRRKLTNWSHL